MNRQEKLEAIRNRKTRYEVVAKHPDGRSIVIGYTHRHSREGIYAVASRNGEETILKLDLQRDAKMFPASNLSVQIGPWNLAFTGRTLRDCILADEA